MGDFFECGAGEGETTRTEVVRNAKGSGSG